MDTPEADDRVLFLGKTLNSLRTHVAVLDESGVIRHVNEAWVTFGCGNGILATHSWIGRNYLQACEESVRSGSEEAAQAARAIRSVLERRTNEGYLEYPCHSADEQRWFSMRVTRFEFDGRLHLVVAHDNITERKLAELEVERVNRRLEQMASIDGLTGISNRRIFDESLRQEWSRHRRSRRPLSVAMIDIDHFKTYNDSCGHQEGDRCLRAVAQTIHRCARRPTDVTARYGGEEFAVILPDTGVDGVETVIERICSSVRALQVPHPSSSTEDFVTVSVGGAVARAIA